MQDDKKTSFVLWFKNINIEDVSFVGGKNASLGEMYQSLTPLGIRIPNGFAITANAYNHFLKVSGLKDQIKDVLKNLDTKNIKNLQEKGKKIRGLILSKKLPSKLTEEIIKTYKKLGNNKNIDVAVRSSATAEDLPGASFAGQQETYLNVKGEKELLISVKKCFASLFTNRAISYRTDKGFSHFDVALSVGVQKMVRSDSASSGVAFTLDTETGFDKVVVINSSYGLGEMIVQGKVTPDEFIVFKPNLQKEFTPIIAKDLGEKQVKMIYSKKGTEIVNVSKTDKNKFSLANNEVILLAKWCVKIEEYFSRKHNRYQPMDIEWAKDGKTKELFIVQARPETIHASQDKNIFKEYKLLKTGNLLLKGVAVGTKIASGKTRIIKNPEKINEFKKGEILVTEITDPDWEPIMKIASAIITDKGGRTSHAAIVSRELGIPCIVGTGKATQVIKAGKNITVDCSSGQTGKIYEGILPFKVLEHHLNKIPKTRTKIMVNIGAPDEAFQNHYLPVSGVGLGRLEFIIASHIKVHPNALIDYQKLKVNHSAIARKIDELTKGYADKKQYYIDELSEGIAKIAATFWPNDVIIRFSDFKTNEYRTLLGGEFYEPEEENPMLGWRGASRYHDEKFEKAFGLECRALKKARDEMGLKNIIPMIPFCRTPEEGKAVLAIMEKYGLKRSEDKSLKVYVMCEIPSNVLLADEFLEVFDGMSIGSNDLTQLILGLDRDSGIISHIANEKNEAVKNMIKSVIKSCKNKNKYIGICGQAPSDYPDFAEFLINEGIESISLNPDVVIKTISMVANKEKYR